MSGLNIRPRGMPNSGGRGRGGHGPPMQNRGHLNNQNHIHPGNVPFLNNDKQTLGAKKRKLAKPHVIPLSASQCLKELCPTYTTHIKDGNGKNFLVITETTNGKQFEGFGSDLLLAKEASAEAALMSYLEMPPNESENDKTQWGVFASFAVYRLLREWKDVDNRTYDSKEFETAKPTVSAIPNSENAVKQQKPISERLQFPNTKGKVDKETTIGDTADLLKKLKESLPEFDDGCIVFEKMKKPFNIETVRCTITVKDNKFYGEGNTEQKSKHSAMKVAVAKLCK